MAFTDRKRCHCSGVISHMRIGLRRWSALIEAWPMPALFTSTSILSKRLSTAETISSNASGRARSAGMVCIVPGLSCTVAASAASPASLRSTAATSTPAPSSPSVIARPMPLAAPVTIAIFFSPAMAVSSVFTTVNCRARSPAAQRQSRRLRRHVGRDRPRNCLRQPDADGRAAPFFALDRQLPAMPVDDVLDDGEP